MNKKILLKIVLLLLLQVFAIHFLAAQPIGFASLNAEGQNGTTGGAGGPAVTVSNASDLIDYISRTGPYIIRISGMISLSSGMYEITSDKTIVGIGSDSGITGGGFNVGLPIDNSITSLPANAVHNVIVRNCNFRDPSDDCMNVMMFSHHIWVDHNTFWNTPDGALDIKRGSNYCTVSYNHFVNIHKTCLLGHADGSTYEAQDSGRLKVSYHHNYFDSCESRQPRVRYGEAHVFNNYYYDVGNYAIGVGAKCQVYSENNYKDGGGAFFSVMGESTGGMIDIGSIGGSSSNPGRVNWNPGSYYSYTLDSAESVKNHVKENAGVGKVGLPPSPTTPPQAMMGDVNGDYSINIVDALIIAQYYVNLNPLVFNPNMADVDCNGTINIVDALQVAQYYVGLITSLGC